MRVLIRADGASHIGSGHVSRCISLAIALRNKGAQVKFVTKEFDASTSDLISEYEFPVFTFAAPTKDRVKEKKSLHTDYVEWLHESQVCDFERMLAVLNGQSFDWLVIDSYSLDIVWERLSRSITERILVIDDLADRQHSCDLLLDQNIPTSLHENYKNLVNRDALSLIGPGYCLLRPEFAEIPKRDRLKNEKLRIVLFFGGADLLNLTKTTLQALTSSGIKKHYNIDVLIGANNSSAEEIRQFCELHHIECFFDVKNMAEYLVMYDLAIVACGFICYELAALNVPSLLVPVSPIQQIVAEAFESAGIAKKLKVESLSCSRAIETKLDSLVEDNSRNFLQFPKNGAERVALEIMK